MKLDIDTKELAKLSKGLKKTKAALKERTKLHQVFKEYQGFRWIDNLYKGGALYKPFGRLQGSTVSVRLWRGLASGPILIGGNRFAPQQMTAWIAKTTDAAQITPPGDYMTTKFEFTFSGRSDGSYAVLHDQGYTAGGMFSGRPVPQRILFTIDEVDVENLLNFTGVFVSNAFKAGGLEIEDV